MKKSSKGVSVSIVLFILGICVWVFVWNIFFQKNTIFSTQENVSMNEEIPFSEVSEKKITISSPLLFWNIEKISSPEDMKKYMETSLFWMSAAYYAIVHKKEELWNMYWNQLFLDNTAAINLSQEDFQKTVTQIYADILSKSFDIWKYPILLDGAIIWSNASIEEKITECKTMQSLGETNEEEKDLQVKSCIGKSIIYESYINKNNMCDTIELPEIKSFCNELISLQ